MKRRSTTPVSKKTFTMRACVIAAAILAATASPISMNKPALADQYDDQIASLQRQIDAYQSQASELGKQADTLQRTLAGLQNEISQIQVQISLNEAQKLQLEQKIEDTKKKIATNKEVLGDTLTDLYVDSGISPLEMLASSSNIADYVDKQEYQSSVRDQLTQKIDEINRLKATLEKDKQNVETVIANQQRSKEALVAKQAEQQNLLDQTKGQEAAYQQLSAQTTAQKQKVMEAQAAAITRASGGIGGVKFIGGGSGGYPWNSSNCYVDGAAMSHGGADGNGGDGWGYGCRQCASYAAWKIGERTGVIPTHLGNANNFPSKFPSSQKGYTARANSVGVIMAGQYGHVVWVESDPDANGNIIVSQYNANYSGASNNWGNFTRVSVPASTYDVFIYF